MVIDSSALISVLLKENGWEALVDKMTAAPQLLIGAPTALESCIVLASRLPELTPEDFREFLEEYGVKIVPFLEAHAEVAQVAYQSYGKGRHPASLNFGDCLTYAIAKHARLPLLFTGDDFSKTDLPAA